jgi:hypothetical protein
MSLSSSRGIGGIALLIAAVGSITAAAQEPYSSSADFEKYARMLRKKALLKLDPLMLCPRRTAR